MIPKPDIRSKISEVNGYPLEKQLGEGGMGEVWKSTHPQMKFPVALKLIDISGTNDLELITRFLKEARLASSVTHPHILRVYEAGEEDDICWMALELCSGSVESMMDKPIPREKAAKWFLQSMEGMHAAHSQGIIHRDLKPGNLLIDGNDRIKIADLGIAKNVEGSFTNTFALTMANTGLGTPHYVSPEQALDAKSVDKRADIYSMGATFFHIFTGRTPFEGKSQMQILNKHITQPLKWPENHDVDEKYVKAINKMMAKKPEERYSSFKEVIEELEEVQDIKVTQPMIDIPEFQDAQTSKSGKKDNSRYIVICCILFAIVVVLALILTSSGK